VRKGCLMLGDEALDWGDSLLNGGKFLVVGGWGD